MGLVFFLVQLVYMKIGIDCRLLGPEQGGLGRYVEQLVKNLGQGQTDHEFVLFLRRANFDQVDTTGLRVTKVLADIPWYGWREQILWPGIVAAQGVDLMHFPHWNIPLRYRGPFVVTIHDLIMYHYPRPEATTLGPIGYWLKDKIARYVVRQAAKRARHILTTSEFTKRDLIQTLGVQPTKITVTYQAPTPLPALVSTVSAIEAPYVLYVGSAYPHKNLDTLVKAWLEVNSQTGGKYRLVLIGNSSPFYRRLERLIAEKQIPNIIRLPHQGDGALAGWYAGASAYVFPSLYEGFGLPPLEAMQFGVPVVASNASCLPEVLGEAAAYFDPVAADDVARAVVAVLQDEQLAATLVVASQAQLSKYTWAKLTAQTLAVYEQN